MGLQPHLVLQQIAIACPDTLPYQMYGGGTTHPALACAEIWWTSTGVFSVSPLSPYMCVEKDRRRSSFIPLAGPRKEHGWSDSIWSKTGGCRQPLSISFAKPCSYIKPKTCTKFGACPMGRRWKKIEVSVWGVACLRWPEFSRHGAPRPLSWTFFQWTWKGWRTFAWLNC